MDELRRDQAAAYALGALDASEQHDFEVHLATCDECRAEVDSLRGVTGALATGAPPLKAPKSVRSAVMAEVRAEAEVMKAAGASADRVPKRWSLAGFQVRPALATLTVVVVVVAAGAGFLAGDRGGTPTRTVSAQVTRAAGAKAAGAIVTRGATVSLRVSGFRDPGPGRVYQVWLAKPGQRSPTPTHALFTVDQDGHGVVELPSAARRGRQVMVTSELAGGSITGVPSRLPVLAATL